MQRYFPFDIPSGWTLSSLIILVVLAALLMIKAVISAQLVRLSSHERFAFLTYPKQLLDATRVWFLLAVAILAGLTPMELKPRHEQWLQYAWVIVLVLQCALWANRLLSAFMRRAFESHRATNPSGATHLLAVGLLLRILLWSVAILLVLDNLGFNITTLAASLGIGGVAVALAVQNILGDIFSSISIALDKPFVIGDFIVVDDFMGTVEYVGLKTTRIRSLGGEQIIMSNTELLKKRIRNYKRMDERRVAFEFAVSHETPAEHVENIPSLVKDAISAAGFQTRFDRSHFKGYGENGLIFETVYFVLTPDFNVYMDIQQSINLAILKQFRRLDIRFSQPVRRIYVDSPSIMPAPNPPPASMPAGDWSQ